MFDLVARVEAHLPLRCRRLRIDATVIVRVASQRIRVDPIQIWVDFPETPEHLIEGVIL